MRSIVSNERVCLICKNTSWLETHNIFYGNGKEQLSKEYGCWCYLCARHHAGAHINNTLEAKLKAHAQKRFNEAYPELDFVKIFDENHLQGGEK